MAGTDLRGFTVAITADRRRDEQAVLMERLGLEVLMFPVLQTEAEDPEVLRELTATVAAQPPDYLLANTGYGMRTWLGLAAQWDLQAALVEGLRARTTIATRGAKALGELRKVGLDAWYKAPGETLEEVVERLLQEDLAGKTVVFQLHGEESAGAVSRLAEAGAAVTSVPIYRMGEGGDHAARGLIKAVLDGVVDAVTFTAAPQIQALFRAAHAQGRAAALLLALNGEGVTAVCIGDVCAAAGRAEGMTAPLVPQHPRLGSLATAVEAHLGARQAVLVGEHGPVRLSGRLVEAGGAELWLGPGEQRALRVIGLGPDGVERPALGGTTADELSHLALALDGALEVSAGRYRLLAGVSG
jgi:uroporphyrinogen-III synthase